MKHLQNRDNILNCSPLIGINQTNCLFFEGDKGKVHQNCKFNDLWEGVHELGRGHIEKHYFFKNLLLYSQT